MLPVRDEHSRGSRGRGRVEEAANHRRVQARGLRRAPVHGAVPGAEERAVRRGGAAPSAPPDRLRQRLAMSVLPEAPLITGREVARSVAWRGLGATLDVYVYPASGRDRAD